MKARRQKSRRWTHIRILVRWKPWSCTLTSIFYPLLTHSSTSSQLNRIYNGSHPTRTMIPKISLPSHLQHSSTYTQMNLKPLAYNAYSWHHLHQWTQQPLSNSTTVMELLHRILPMIWFVSYANFHSSESIAASIPTMEQTDFQLNR